MFLRRNSTLPGRSSKDHDFATVVKGVVEQAMGEQWDGSPLPDPNAGKNPAAVALGRLGGRLRRQGCGGRTESVASCILIYNGNGFVFLAYLKGRRKTAKSDSRVQEAGHRSSHRPGQASLRRGDLQRLP